MAEGILSSMKSSTLIASDSDEEEIMREVVWIVYSVGQKMGPQTSDHNFVNS